MMHACTHWWENEHTNNFPIIFPIFCEFVPLLLTICSFTPLTICSFTPLTICPFTSHHLSLYFSPFVPLLLTICPFYFSPFVPLLPTCMLHNTFSCVRLFNFTCRLLQNSLLTIQHWKDWKDRRRTLDQAFMRRYAIILERFRFT